MSHVSVKCNTVLSHPLVFSATGGMGHEATIFYKRSASLLSEKWKEPSLQYQVGSGVGNLFVCYIQL